MSDINFPKEVRDQLLDKLQRYMGKELDVELGQFDAEFLLDFITKEMGAFFYNRGVYDAQELLQSKIENLTESFYELEKDAL